jgi:hypothetical protein
MAMQTLNSTRKRMHLFGARLTPLVLENSIARAILSLALALTNASKIK